MACTDGHAGNPSFLDLQTCTQKPCADSSSMECNGAVSCSKSHPPPIPSLLSPSLPLSLSLSIPPPQMKTGLHRWCQHLIGWAIIGVDAREREERERERELRGRENAQEDATTLPQHPDWAQSRGTHEVLTCVVLSASQILGPPIDGKRSGLKLPPRCHWNEFSGWKVQTSNSWADWSKALWTSASPALDRSLLTEQLLVIAGYLKF